MNTAEDYFLSRDLVKEDEIDPGVGDAILCYLAAHCLGYRWKDDICSHTYGIWGGKTQGEVYHMYLLAIACLIEARLGEKAFVYGDFVRKVFSEGTISTCWKKKLTEYEIGTSGFSSFFREYMTQGFGLEELCGYVKLQDKDGQDIHRNDDQ